MNQSNQINITSARDADTLLVFRINTYFFCTHTHAVISIIEPPKISRIPLSPPSLVGLTFFQGEPIPVYCLRTYLGEPVSAKKRDGVVIVANTDDGMIGVWVDETCNIIDAEKENYRNPDLVFSRSFVKYFIPTNDKILLYIDLDRLVTNIKTRQSFASHWLQFNSNLDTRAKNQNSIHRPLLGNRADDKSLTESNSLSPNSLSSITGATGNTVKRSSPAETSQTMTNASTTAPHPSEASSKAMPLGTKHVTGKSSDNVTVRSAQSTNPLKRKAVPVGYDSGPTKKQEHIIDKNNPDKQNNTLHANQHKSSATDITKSHVFDTRTNQDTLRSDKTNFGRPSTATPTVKDNNTSTIHHTSTSHCSIERNSNRGSDYLKNGGPQWHKENIVEDNVSRVSNYHLTKTAGSNSEFESVTHKTLTTRDSSVTLSTNNAGFTHTLANTEAFTKTHSHPTKSANFLTDSADFNRSPIDTKGFTQTQDQPNKSAGGWLTLGTVAALILALLLWWPFSDNHPDRINTDSHQRPESVQIPSASNISDDTYKHYSTSTSQQPAQQIEEDSRRQTLLSSNPSAKSGVNTAAIPTSSPITTTITAPPVASTENDTTGNLITAAKQQTANTHTATPKRNVISDPPHNITEPKASGKDIKHENGVILEFETETYSIVIERPKSNIPRDISSKSFSTNTVYKNRATTDSQASNNRLDKIRKETANNQYNGEGESTRLADQQLTPSKLQHEHKTRARYEEFIYVVVKGDTLWDIAARFLGDPYKYKLLSELSHVRDPDWIYPGDIVTIRKIKR